MRLALQGTGFAINAELPAVDLRDSPEDAEDELFFLTLLNGSTNNTSTTFSEVDATENSVLLFDNAINKLDRLPVRGPIAIQTGDIVQLSGFLQLPGADGDDAIVPFSPSADPPVSPFVLTPLVFTETQEGVVICVQSQEVTMNLTLFAVTPNSDDSVRFYYTPQNAAPVAGSIFRQSGGNRTQFAKVANRIPCTGPGTITADVVVEVGPVMIYGYWTVGSSNGAHRVITDVIGGGS